MINPTGAEQRRSSRLLHFLFIINIIIHFHFRPKIQRNFCYLLAVSTELNSVGITVELSLRFYDGAILRMSSQNKSFALVQLVGPSTKIASNDIFLLKKEFGLSSRVSLKNWELEKLLSNSLVLNPFIQCSERGQEAREKWPCKIQQSHFRELIFQNRTTIIHAFACMLQQIKLCLWYMGKILCSQSVHQND